MKINEIAKFIDHTALKPEKTREEINNLCEEAVKYGFASVCVNPCNVTHAYKALKGTKIPVCAVVGFPLGANKSILKAYEAKEAINDGAKEIDMVLNIGELKNRNYELVKKEVKMIRKSIGKRIILKVIIEASILTKEEKIKAAELLILGGANYVKTSTGMNPAGGATIQDIMLLKKITKGKIKIKASGGIRDSATALSMIKAGANRIGTSSGIKIAKDV